ncbi:MAG: hypothetical protein E7425_02895 [Ruminococcaceae bacterium]|jgi:flagellar hook-length control protein FliK|nr:hypothetical protein [Oscillospiraceae bacterium]
MEVKNQMLDQLLVNGAQQTPTASGAAKQKEADAPDFDRMVSQRRSTVEKSEPKAAKQDKPVQTEEADDTQTQSTEAIVDDGQYAIAAAMMYQMQSELRVEQIPQEQIPELMTEAVQAVETQEQTVELPEMPVTQTPVAEGTQEAALELAQAAPDTQKPVETPVENKPETIVDAKPEVKPEQPVENAGQNEQPVQTQREETPRTENAPERAQTVRSEAKPETEAKDADEADAAQTAQAQPLFEKVDAPVVKVAEASRPIPLEAEDGVEQLGRELDSVLVNSADANRVEITLTPENLGKLTVEITRNEGGNLSIVLHATNERTANLLEKHVTNLQNALTTGNRSEVEVQVRSAGETEQRQFLDPNGQNDRNGQQQQQNGRRREQQQSAEDFLQQLRLGLVDNDNR